MEDYSTGRGRKFLTHAATWKNFHAKFNKTVRKGKHVVFSLTKDIREVVKLIETERGQVIIRILDTKEWEIVD